MCAEAEPAGTETSRRGLLRAAVTASAGSALGVASGVAALADPAAAGAPRRQRTCRCASRKKCKCACRGHYRGGCPCTRCHGPKSKGACRCHRHEGQPPTSGGPGGDPDPGPDPGGDPDPGGPRPPLLDDPAGRVLVSRFTHGLTPGLVAEVDAAGGAFAWFTHQLAPAAIADAAADSTYGWWPSLDNPPATVWSRHIAGTEYGWQLMQSYQRWLLMRRISTRRQVQEVMTAFWENHFNVPVQGDSVFVHRVGYGRTIRPLALGRFEDLLRATVVHPAMGLYLGNAVSTKVHPNENLGRELLELHTVGRGQYDEDDVKDSARILTGWRVAGPSGGWAAAYQPNDHYVGPVSVMGFSHANAEADGQAVTMQYLSYLARHPETARRIARKLCVRFCLDQPSSALVELLASTYLAADTAIGPVLEALVHDVEFQGATGAKVRDPAEDVVATYRALDVAVAAPGSPVPEGHVTNALLWQCNGLGAEPHAWPQPNGQPADNDSWSSPVRFAASLDLHVTMAGGWWPTVGATYRTPASWLPGTTFTLEQLVQHLAVQVLSQHSTPQLVTACSQVTGYPPSTVLTANHAIVRWMFPWVLATLLDSPLHMTR
jgi:uncharacterized protein (DUF1800 family)